jgi:hypothetical protein
MEAFTSILPLAAGGINLVSTVPRIVRLARNPSEATAECLWRALLPVIANGLWVSYGLILGLVMMPAMCALAMALNGTILGFIVFARYGRCTRLGEVCHSTATQVGHSGVSQIRRY